jgi:hypothetical protein
VTLSTRVLTALGSDQDRDSAIGIVTPAGE